MRGFIEVNGSGRLTERLVVVIDLIIDDGGILRCATGRGSGRGSGRGLTPEAYPAPLRSVVGIIPSGALRGLRDPNRGVYSVKCGHPRARNFAYSAFV